ncbi:MAG: OadG family protein [Chloroflexi bacterium]|nr:OadG family protein [Chloroflexota bacterium]
MGYGHAMRVHHLRHKEVSSLNFSDFPYGITVTVIGMGVTFATLALLACICIGLRKIFPYKEEEEGQKE